MLVPTSSDDHLEDEWRAAIGVSRVRPGPYGGSYGGSSRDPAPPKESSLAAKLLIDWSNCDISTPKIQEYAKCCMDDIKASGGTPPEDLVKLAQMGTYGQHPQNIRRDLVAYLSTFLPVFSFTFAMLPLKVHKGEDMGVRNLPHCLILPHKIFAYVYTHFKTAFNYLFFNNDVGSVQKFWDHVHVDDPRRLNNPIFKSKSLLKKMIPLELHGDKVPCTKKLGLDVASVRSLLSQVSDSILMIAFIFAEVMVPESEDIPESTWTMYWQVLVWSFKALESRRWPEKDWLGNSFVDESSIDFRMRGQFLAGGWGAQIWLNKADSDHFINVYKMPGHWGAHQCCRMCPANDSVGTLMSWNCFRPDAEWKLRIHKGNEVWFGYSVAAGKEIWLCFKDRNVGGLGLSVYTCFDDGMHSVDLGVSPHLLGNVLWHLCYTDILGPGTPQERLDRVKAYVFGEYSTRSTGTQFSNIDLGMFTNEENPAAARPFLKGKAAENRHLVPILRDLWRSAARNTYEDHVTQCLEHLSIYYEILDYKLADGSYPLYLPTNLQESFTTAVDSFLMHYNWLYSWALGRGRELWHYVPKFHYMWHQTDQAKYMNPRAARCYVNEDFMGVAQKLGVANRHAVVAAKRSKGMCVHYIYGLGLKLLKFEKKYS